MRVLGISGSLRRDSYDTKLLRHAGDLFASEGVEFEIYEGLKDVPPYDEDDDMESAPDAVSRIREAVRVADAVFLTTPEHNSSIPGALKNALDWVSRPLAANAMQNKPVAVIGASAGVFGAVWAQAELRKVLDAMGARVAEGEVTVGRAMDPFDANGRLSEPQPPGRGARDRSHADRRSQEVRGPRPTRRLTRQEGASHVMTPTDHVRRTFAAFDSKDVSALAAFVTDDVRLRLGNAEPVRGKSAFVEAVNVFLASVGGFRHEVLNVWSDGDALIAEFDVHYTRLDGGEVTLPCCNLFRLRDGLVAEYRSYIDATPVYS